MNQREQNVGASIDYERFLDCVHCGLCTAACPTYVELGDENDSPRGRIYLMRNVVDGRLEMSPEVRRHLELCLDCRACESACPSGVQYGKLIEPFRIDMEAGAPKTADWFHRWILFGLFPSRGRLSWSLVPARLAQQLGLHRAFVRSGMWKWLPARLGRLVTLLPRLGKRQRELPGRLPAIGPRRAKVALFLGCVADAMFRPTHWATARVLQENGCEVVIPRQQQCCGAIHFHAGNADPARRLADINASSLLSENIDAVIVNVAGCGAMLKDYDHLWHSDGSADDQTARESLARKTMDISEFLDQLGMIPPTGELPMKVTYHDACHLAHAQQVRSQPRNLLRQIPGLELVELTESEICCGAAGTYNITEPEMADRLGARKLENIRRTGAQVVVTANAGCLLQIARQASMKGEPISIAHPVDLLDLSYRREPFPTQDD